MTFFQPSNLIKLALVGLLFVTCEGTDMSTALAAYTPQTGSVITKASEEAGCNEFQRLQNIFRDVNGVSKEPFNMQKHYKQPNSVMTAMNINGMFGDFLKNGFDKLQGPIQSMMTSFGQNGAGTTDPRTKQQGTGSGCQPAQYTSKAGTTDRRETRANP